MKLDLALALYSRRLFKSPSITREHTAIGQFYYMWADASPQAGPRVVTESCTRLIDTLPATTVPTPIRDQQFGTSVSCDVAGMAARQTSVNVGTYHSDASKLSKFTVMHTQAARVGPTLPKLAVSFRHSGPFSFAHPVTSWCMV